MNQVREMRSKKVEPKKKLLILRYDKILDAEINLTKIETKLASGVEKGEDEASIFNWKLYGEKVNFRFYL
jgi:hypothetical protein